MDEFGPRAAQLKSLADFMNLGSQYQRRKSLGQVGLFENSDAEILPAKKLPDIKEFPQTQLLAWEKELLGLYLSEHPQQKELQELQNFVTCPLSEVSLDDVGKNLVLGGMIGNMRIIVTRQGNKEMAFVRLQDEGGSLEAIVFPKAWEASKKFLKEDEVVLASGRIDHKEESDLKILVDKMVPLARAAELVRESTNQRINESVNPPNSQNSLTPDDDGPPAWLQPAATEELGSQKTEGQKNHETMKQFSARGGSAFGGSNLTINFSNPHLEISIPVVDKDLLKETLERIKSILSQYPGETPVVLLLQNGPDKPTRLPLSFRVSYSPALKTELKKV